MRQWAVRVNMCRLTPEYLCCDVKYNSGMLTHGLCSTVYRNQWSTDHVLHTRSSTERGEVFVSSLETITSSEC